MFHKFRIETDENQPIYKKVFMDGQELKGVTSCDIRIRTDEIPVVELEIATNNIEVDTEAYVETRTQDVTDILEQSVIDLDLSARTLRALYAGAAMTTPGKYNYVLIRTVGDVLNEYRTGRLKDILGIGKSSIREIEEALRKKGLIGGDDC